MRIATVAANVILFAFTLVVIVTDGISGELPYLFFTLLLLAVPVLTLAAVVPLRSGRRPDVRAGWATVVSNIVLFALACWAIADQYPHPPEDGVVAFTVVVLLTPILSSTVVLAGLRKRGAR